MYSALVKLFRAFLHSLALTVAAALLLAIIGACLETVLEVWYFCGNPWVIRFLTRLGY